MTSPPTRRKRQGVPYDRHRLRLRRINAGLSQTALAEETGLSVQSISAYETGANGPSPEALAIIADALDCEIADLLTKPGRRHR